MDIDVETTDKLDLEYINQHRDACDLPRFESLSHDEITEQLKLIAKHAPYGDDPWSGETIGCIPPQR